VENVPSVEKSTTGLDVNVAGALAYLLWFISGIALFVIEKDSKFVRFHALQSSIVFGVLFLVPAVLAQIPFLGWVMALLLWPICTIVTLILWLVLMFKAYQGEKFKLPIVGDIAERHA
jgi:uncharacterized membrane protein